MTFISNYKEYYLESTSYYGLVSDISNADEKSLDIITSKIPSYLEIIIKGENAAQSYISKIALNDSILLGEKINTGLVHSINSENIIRLEFFLRVLEMSSFPSFEGLKFLFQSFYNGLISTSDYKGITPFTYKIKHLVEYMLDVLISIQPDKTIVPSIVPSIVSLAGHTFDEELEIIDVNVKSLTLLRLINTKLSIDGLKKIAFSTENREIAEEAKEQLGYLT